MRQAHGFAFGKSDLFMLCAASLDSATHDTDTSGRPILSLCEKVTPVVMRLMQPASELAMCTQSMGAQPALFSAFQLLTQCSPAASPVLEHYLLCWRSHHNESVVQISCAGALLHCAHWSQACTGS
jgi:hypothetical protein